MGVLKSIRMCVASQAAQARNMHETNITRVRRAVWASVYLMKAMCIALRWTRHECLGSTVVFGGKLCSVSNWARSEYPTLSSDGFYKQNVPRSEITSVVNAGEIIHRFRSGLAFYLMSWHSIDVNKRIYPEHFSRSSEA